MDHETRIRTEAPGDAATIRAVIQHAFHGQPYACGREAAIVDELRAAGALSVSLLLEHQGQIIAHLAASPVVTASGHEGWHGIGPVAVEPAFQRRGHGSRLILTALEQLRRNGAHGVVLVGHPGYYTRFGFVADGSAEVEGVPASVTFCLKLQSGPNPGRVTFHPAFGLP